MSLRRTLLTATLLVASGLLLLPPEAFAGHRHRATRARRADTSALSVKTHGTTAMTPPSLELDETLKVRTPRCATCVQISDARLGKRLGVTSSSVYGDRLRLYLK